MPKSITCSLLSLLFLFLLGSATLLADLELPPPQTEGGAGIFEALKKRSSASGGDFSIAELGLPELSSVLWAASGLNRGETGWTVPMAEGLPPYVDVYVAATNGVFLYDYKAHKLIEISKENIKGKIGEQSFVKKASHILIFVANPEGLSKLRNQAAATEFADVLTGAMTQNVYLVAASLKLGARYIHSMRTDDIKSALNLTEEGQRPVAIMMLGK
jgi:SagB-type dehydrogenase family enzyme